MKRRIIAATGPVDPLMNQMLLPFGDIVCTADNSEGALLTVIEEAIGLIVRGDCIVGKRVIAAARFLQVIGRTGAGYDGVDVAAATERGIPVLYTPGANAHAVAEAAMALILALAKNLTYWDEQLKSGNWKSRFTTQSRDLEGAVLGIIGFGSTGNALARLAQPFGMTVLAHDPCGDRQTASELNVHLVSLEELLRNSDYISLHVGLTPQTRGMINRESLSLIKPGCCLVNTARGAIIESLDVLHEALLNGILAGVGLDVFDPEPPDANHPIFRSSRCLTSPHALALTRGAMTKVFRILAEDMATFFRGERPRFVVNKEVIRTTVPPIVQMK